MFSLNTLTISEEATDEHIYITIILNIHKDIEKGRKIKGYIGKGVKGVQVEQDDPTDLCKNVDWQTDRKTRRDGNWLTDRQTDWEIVKTSMLFDFILDILPDRKKDSNRRTYNQPTKSYLNKQRIGKITYTED